MKTPVNEGRVREENEKLKVLLTDFIPQTSFCPRNGFHFYLCERLDNLDDFSSRSLACKVFLKILDQLNNQLRWNSHYSRFLLLIFNFIFFSPKKNVLIFNRD